MRIAFTAVAQRCGKIRCLPQPLRVAGSSDEWVGMAREGDGAGGGAEGVARARWAARGLLQGCFIPVSVKKHSFCLSLGLDCPYGHEHCAP